MNFNNKIVIVTGGSKGIGASITKAFAKRGATVCVLDINKEAFQNLKSHHEIYFEKIELYEVDVSNIISVSQCIESIINKYKKIDVLVNNAGIVNTTNFDETTEEEWDKVMSINLKGVYNTCRNIYPIMKKQGFGNIVNISSIAGKIGGGIFGKSIYVTSKAGVIGLTKAIAKEGGPYGINANVVCPGPTDTGILDQWDSEKKNEFLKTIPLRRIANPEEIAYGVLFLSSDLSSYINGEIMDIDGGIVMD